MKGLPGRKHLLWLVGVAGLGLAAEPALRGWRRGSTDDPTVVYLLGAAGMLGIIAFWTAQDVARRWRVWRRRRMTRWQRRAQADGAAVGFEVVATAPGESSREGPRAALCYHARPASRRWLLIATVAVVWTAVAAMLAAVVEDVLIPFILR